jgi:hypothetical protein
MKMIKKQFGNGVIVKVLLLLLWTTPNNNVTRGKAALHGPLTVGPEL